MQPPTKQIYSEGKLKFTSRLHARQMQYQLKKAGFVYETDNQRIRPGAYGVMWRKVYGHGAYRATMRTAGNETAFKAYGAHKKDSLYVDAAHVVNNVPGRTKVFENCRNAQRETDEIVFGIFNYLLGLNIGYDFTARRNKKGAAIRLATWSAFAWLLHEKHPLAKPFQVNRSIRKKYAGAPESKKLEEFLKHGRPQGLPIM